MRDPVYNSDHELYNVWNDMNQRCHSVGDRSYKNYGGRGITVCARWRKSLENFCLDMSPRPAGTSLDRIDNHAGYSKENCRWTDRVTQSQNSRRVTEAKHAYYYKAYSKWLASFRYNKKRFFVGYYETESIAIEASKKAKERLLSDKP